MRNVIGLSAVLTVFWLVLSGHYTPMILGFGVASIALVVWLANRMDIVDQEGRPLELSFGAPAFWAWLSWQIMLSSWDVTRRVWTGKPTVLPAMGRVDASKMTPLEQVTYANSITLTPGTLSVSVHDEDIEVHALDAQLIEDLASGSMAERARRVAGE